jgi:hypothetical protein
MGEHTSLTTVSSFFTDPGECLLTVKPSHLHFGADPAILSALSLNPLFDSKTLMQAHASSLLLEVLRPDEGGEDPWDCLLVKLDNTFMTIAFIFDVVSHTVVSQKLKIRVKIFFAPIQPCVPRGM